MNEITLLAKSGLGWQGIGGIILLLTGIGLIYFGIKALQGYRFFPEQEHNIPEEDHYEPTQAKALQKVKTTMPDFNGGEDRVFTEWKIGYTVDGEKYTTIATSASDGWNNPVATLAYSGAEGAHKVSVKPVTQDGEDKMTYVEILGFGVA